MSFGVFNPFIQVLVEEPAASPTHQQFTEALKGILVAQKAVSPTLYITYKLRAHWLQAFCFFFGLRNSYLWSLPAGTTTPPFFSRQLKYPGSGAMTKSAQNSSGTDALKFYMSKHCFSVLSLASTMQAHQCQCNSHIPNGGDIIPSKGQILLLRGTKILTFMHKVHLGIYLSRICTKYSCSIIRMSQAGTTRKKSLQMLGTGKRGTVVAITKTVGLTAPTHQDENLRNNS